MSLSGLSHVIFLNRRGQISLASHPQISADERLQVAIQHLINVANLDPALERQAAPETPAPLLKRFPGGLTTQEVAALMTAGNEAPDRKAAEAALIELVAEGLATRTQLGDDALWLASAPGARSASGLA